MASPNPQSASPRWGPTTKLVVALTMIAVVAALMVQFRGIIPPLMLVFIVAYLLYPVAAFLARQLHMSWRWAVNLIYLLLILIILGLLTLGGVGLIQQLQSLISLANRGLETLPTLIGEMSARVYQFGPFTIDLSQFDLLTLSNQLLAAIEPFLGRTGTVVATIASGAVNVFGWTMFVLLVSYFLLSESKGLQPGLVKINIPGYASDFDRMGRELARIWNAFLRGQIIIMGLAVVIYTLILSTMGVSYAIGIALLAGLARFLPYIGPFILYIVLGLVTYFQGFKIFGLPPLTYTLIVIGLAWLSDSIIDNFVSPRIMADALEVHPAAVLVAAIIAFELIGILGIVIAAPILATLKLLSQYTLNKMFDRNPWEGIAEKPPSPTLRDNLQPLWQKILSFRKHKPPRPDL
jgi:predicted PurR-regulated permease PerM